MVAGESKSSHHTNAIAQNQSCGTITSKDVVRSFSKLQGFPLMSQ